MNKLLVIFLISLSIFLSFATIAMAYEKEIQDISTSITHDIVRSGKKTIAVVDFTNLQGSVTELGRFIAEELSVDLTMTSKEFEVIDRIHLKSILTENKLSMSGLVDPNTLQKLGRIAGVTAIITGSVTPFGDSVRVTCKVIATDTARVISASKVDIAKTKVIEELLAKGIDTGATPGEQQAGIPAPKPVAKGRQEEEANNFRFQLQQCKLSGKTVTCNLLVTNNDNDRTLAIGADYSFSGATHTRIFDDKGNEFNRESITLGNVNSTLMVENVLVSGIPTKLRLTFNVDSQPAFLSLLEIGCVAKPQYKSFEVGFRNITFTIQ